MIKKFFSIVIISIMFFSLADFAFAQGRELEIEYPEVAGEQPEQVTTPVTEYFKYIFNFLIWISGLIALVVLIYAGFQYFTSAGNPEAMNDAKNRIGAALLGILILFGSYLILTTINPDLIVFHLPRLKPIISELTPGVLVCKEEAEVDRAWQLTNNFKQAEEYWEQEMIAEELEQIFEDMSEQCYMVLSAGNIRGDFADKITDIYFIAGEQKIDGVNYIAAYGAVLYEDSGYEGKSQPIYDHLKPGTLGGVVPPEHIPIDPKTEVNPSSIKPFVLIPEHHEEKKQVVLYEQYNRNQGIDALGIGYHLPTGNWYDTLDLTKDETSKAFCYSSEFCSPRSIKVGGPFIAILVAPDKRSDTFYDVIDNNLDDNLNIVNWVDCKEYESTETKTEYKTSGMAMWYEYKCAQPAVKKLIIISAKLY